MVLSLQDTQKQGNYKSNSKTGSQNCKKLKSNNLLKHLSYTWTLPFTNKGCVTKLNFFFIGFFLVFNETIFDEVLLAIFFLKSKVELYLKLRNQMGFTTIYTLLLQSLIGTFNAITLLQQKTEIVKFGKTYGVMKLST